MKERVVLLPEFLETGYYFFEPVKEYDEKTIRKRWKPERLELFEELKSLIVDTDPFAAEALELKVKAFMTDNGLGFGDILPILRVALTGTMKGPAVFDMMETLGKFEVKNRLELAYTYFNKVSLGV